jgi:hypothetical protein
LDKSIDTKKFQVTTAYSSLGCARVIYKAQMLSAMEIEEVI